jgi:hypothetical protein
MTERYLGQIVPGLDVCDMEGAKVGTVARVLREDVSVVDAPDDDIVEVKTGPFGLGHRLYVPVGAIDNATTAALFVRASHDEMEKSWTKKPDYLGRLH